MEFAYPSLLYLLFLPALLLVIAYSVGKHRSTLWRRIVSPQLENELVFPPNHARRILAIIFGLVGMALMIIALARPQWGEHQVTEFSRGRNLIIAFDISRSMTTRDVQPSRLEQARTAAFDLLEALPEDNIGLIVFSGDASLVVPLTHDHNAIRETLEQANYSWVTNGGTNFNDVLTKTLDAFDHTEGTKALVLITDGENTEAIDQKLTTKAQQEGLIVVAAGIGTASGDVIPDAKAPDGRFRNIKGQLVVSKFNPDSLQELTVATKGTYASINTGKQLTNLVKTVASKLDEKEDASQDRKVKDEHYAPFLAAGLILLTFALLLSAQWSKRKPLQWTAPLLLCFWSISSIQGQSISNPTNNPIRTSTKNTVPFTAQGIEKKPQNLTIENICDPKILSRITDEERAFIQAEVDYKNKQWEKSITNFSKALTLENKKTELASRYNLANAIVQSNLEKISEDKDNKIISDQKTFDSIIISLQEALKHYDNILATEPNHAKAQFNKRITEKLIQKLKEEKKKHDDQKQNKDNQQDQNKDQQGKDNQQDQNKDQQGKNNQQDQNKNQQGKDNQQDQNKDQQGKDNQQDQNKDQQGKDNQQDQNKDQNKDQQGKDNQQDQNKDQQGKDNQQDQNKNQQGKGNQQDQNKDQQGSQAIPIEEENEGNPNRQNAARILRERSDLEKGNPFPMPYNGKRPSQDW